MRTLQSTTSLFMSISNLVVAAPSCFRPTPTVTSGSSTTCFPLWWLALFGCSHSAGMAELQLRSRSWGALLPKSHQEHPQSEVAQPRVSSFDRQIVFVVFLTFSFSALLLQIFQHWVHCPQIFLPPPQRAQF